MFEIQSPSESLVRIPFSTDEDQLYFRELNDDAAAYLAEEGYVVLRGMFDHRQYGQVKRAFAEEVKPYGGHMYRQVKANAERNRFNAAGHVMNSLLNLQDIDPRKFPRLRRLALDMFTSPALVKALRRVFGEDPKLVQSMYFEGNSETWAHQDTYYLDSENIGTMLGAWFALEDIHPGAGRFFIYPGSHRLDMAKNGGDFDIAFNHERYKRLIIDIVNRESLELRAPALAAGDVLLWNSKTIHGSLRTRDTTNSRQSLTAHFIPRSHRFLQWQSRIKPLSLDTHNGIQIHCPKDQRRLKNRCVFFMESQLPGPFYSVKRLAVKLATR